MSINEVQHLSSVRLNRQPEFRLGASKVRPSTLEVEREDGREILEPRVMQVLVALHRAHPDVMSRDDLIAQCWDGRTVGEDALNRAIGRLRRLSKADDGRSFTIKTIVRVGYRLMPASPAAARRPAALPWQALPTLRHAPTESLTEAMGLYEQIVAATPEYAGGWGGLALAYACVAHNMASAAAAMRLRSLAAIRRAEALDPDSTVIAEAKARLLSLRGVWLEAERAFRRELKSDPGNSLLLGLSYALSGAGPPLEVDLPPAPTGMPAGPGDIATPPRRQAG